MSSDSLLRSFAESVGFSSFVTQGYVRYLPNSLMLSRACCPGVVDSGTPVSLPAIYMCTVVIASVQILYHPLISLVYP